MIKLPSESNSIFGFFRVGILSLLTFMLAGCSTLSVDERDLIARMAEETVETLCADNPELRDEINESPGYLVIDKRVVKVPVLGGGSGRGVVIETGSEKMTFIKASRMEIGGGWGARSYKMLMVFHDPRRFEKMQGGAWIYELGAEATAGKASLEGTSEDANPKSGYKVYTLTDGGASATYTLRAIRLKPYRD